MLLSAVVSPAGAGEFINGTDISALTVLENRGATYSKNGVVGDAIDILESNGVNWHRLRIFVNPTGSDPVAVQDLAYTIALAQRAKANGSRLLLDFHYSDTWADPGKQFKPSAWNLLNAEALKTQVKNYSASVITAMKNAGVMPEMVQVGNEISNGMLWNNGRLWLSGVPEDTEFENLASLISKGIEGVKEASDPGNEPLIMIHHDKGGDWGTTSYYFDRLLPKLTAKGTPADVIGYSYYPLHHYNENACNPSGMNCGSMLDVRANLLNTVNTYNLPVVMVEAGFASRDESSAPYEFQVTPQGQKQYLEAVVDALQDIPNGMGWGLFWWYAEATPVDDNGTVWKYGSYGLFDKGVNWPNYALPSEALPAQQVFADIAADFSTLPGDFNDDGSVDGLDFLLLQQELGQTGLLAGDTNGDFRVNAEDLAIWEAAYGNPGPLADSISVPEPTSAVLFLIALITARRLRK